MASPISSFGQRFDAATPLFIDPSEPTYAGPASGNVSKAVKDLSAQLPSGDEPATLLNSDTDAADFLEKRRTWGMPANKPDDDAAASFLEQRRAGTPAVAGEAAPSSSPQMQSPRAEYSGLFGETVPQIHALTDWIQQNPKEATTIAGGLAAIPIGVALAAGGPELALAGGLAALGYGARGLWHLMKIGGSAAITGTTIDAAVHGGNSLAGGLWRAMRGTP